MGDRVSHFETEIQRRDGMPVPISLSARAVAGAPARAPSIVLVARDITEQQLAQATLAEIDARMRESEALAHVGGWLWDVRTGAVQWSDEFHRIHGIDPLDFDGTLEAHLSLIDDEHRPRVRHALEEAAARGTPFEEVYAIVRPDGHTRWIHARATATIGSAGTVVGLRGIGHDVTDRHREAAAASE